MSKQTLREKLKCELIFTENAVLRNLDQNKYDICYKIGESLRDYIIIKTKEILY